MTDDIQRQKQDLEREYKALQGDVAMTTLQSTLSSTATTIAGLPERIKAVRGRGYAYAGYLEGKAEMLAKQWAEVEQHARQAVQAKGNELQSALQSITEKYTSMLGAEGLAAATYVKQVEPELRRIRAEVDVALESVKSTFGKVPENTQQTLRQLTTIEGYLDLTDSATFELQAAESVFMAVEAEYRDDKDNPDGVLYLTDQRIIMEQKEKVGKTLGLFGGQMKHEILWQAPINTIDQVAHENKGLLGGIDLVYITFGTGAPLGKVTVEVKGGIQAEWFAAQLKRAASGGLQKERGLELDQELVEALVNAPTTCPVCGATFEQAIVAGMNQIKCTYCGAVTRLAI